MRIRGDTLAGHLAVTDAGVAAMRATMLKATLWALLVVATLPVGDRYYYRGRHRRGLALGSSAQQGLVLA